MACVMHRQGSANPQGDFTMPRCATCGNDYDKAFRGNAGESSWFDSFECAIQAMAPPAVIAAAESSATAWRRRTSSIAAFTVLPPRSDGAGTGRPEQGLPTAVRDTDAPPCHRLPTASRKRRGYLVSNRH